MMDYYQLKSVFSSRKKQFDLLHPSDSFLLAGPSTRAYVEPSFEKIIYEAEKPTVILVSAVGATGKTALANHLSREVGLPVLDLGTHKPVGADTLTGLLTGVFDVRQIGKVFEGMADGTYGIIVDGLDEGRAKTTAKGFEAFLDDVVKLSRTSPCTTFVMLGRTQALEDCWEYLSTQGVQTALVTIAPFDIAGATRYIDIFSGGPKSAFAPQYIEVRDFIIGRLRSAFSMSPGPKDDQFLSFIGYPPVLDAIATLLANEKNYHGLLQVLRSDAARDIEVSLLKRIAEYILTREREHKVLPNIVTPLVESAPEDIRRSALSSAFLFEEQSARLVAYCLGRPLTISVIPESSINAKYEAQLLKTWLPEHPFLSGRVFQNAVFEALAVSHLLQSQVAAHQGLAADYLSSHKSSYHLIYMLEANSEDRFVSATHISAILASAMEFRSVHSLVELRVDVPKTEDEECTGSGCTRVDIEIEILVGEEHKLAKAFAFHSEIDFATRLALGARLASAFITVPCEIVLGCAQEIELVAPVEIKAKSIHLLAKELVVRAAGGKSSPSEVILQATDVASTVESIVSSGAVLHICVQDMGGVAYPLTRVASKVMAPPADPTLRQKYLRLKRILLAFRSHSRGSLARYRLKIENERIIGNVAGKAVLARLVKDRVLELRGDFYHLNPDGVNANLGVTWLDLRKGQISERLVSYLRSIVVNA